MSPEALLAHYRYDGAVIAEFLREGDECRALRGRVICAIRHSLEYVVHPLAIYSAYHRMQPIPTTGLVSSRDPRFVYEIKTRRPLRTRNDAEELTQSWVRTHVDGLPAH